MFRHLDILVLTAAWLLSVSSGQAGEVHSTVPQMTGQTHTYYIAADEVDWNYAPAEMDHMTGKPYDEVARNFVENGPSTSAGSIARPCIGSIRTPHSPS